MTLTILLYLSIFCASFITLTIIGHVFYSIFIPEINKPYLKLFVKFALGIILFTVSTALYHTSGQTILVLFLLIILFFILERKILINKISFKNIIRVPSLKKLSFYLISILIPGVLFFLWEVFFMFKTGEFNFIIAPADFQHYSEISTSLSITGQENTFGLKNLLYNDFNGNTPYHYLDLWFNNAITNIFNTKNIVSLMTVTYPIFFLITYIGFCSMWEYYGKVGWKQKVSSVLFIGLGAVCLEFYEHIPYLGAGGSIAVSPVKTYFRKYIIFYLFVISSWLFFHHKKIVPSIISLLCLPIIFIGSAPGIILGLITFLIIGNKLNKIDKKSTFKALGYTLSIAMAIGLFYITMNKPSVFIDDFGSIFSIKTWTELITYKTIFNIYLLTSAQYIFYFLPFILLIYLFTNKEKRRIFKPLKISLSSILLIIIYITSLSAWAFLYKLGNARQFFSNGVAILIVVWLIGLIIRTSYKSQKSYLFIALILLMILPNFYNPIDNNPKYIYHSDKYLSSTLSLINQIDTDLVLGGILYSKAETYELAHRRDKAYHIYPLAHYTNYSKNIVDVQNLSVFDSPPLKDTFNEERFKSIVEIVPFYRYVKNEKEKGIFKNIKNSQTNFINDFKLDFIIIRKNAPTPDYLKKLTKEVIIDEKSGDKFILLKNKQHEG